MPTASYSARLTDRPAVDERARDDARRRPARTFEQHRALAGAGGPGGAVPRDPAAQAGVATGYAGAAGRRPGPARRREAGVREGLGRLGPRPRGGRGAAGIPHGARRLGRRRGARGARLGRAAGHRRCRGSRAVGCAGDVAGPHGGGRAHRGAGARRQLRGAAVGVDPVAGLRDLLDDGWAASPVDRMEAMLRAGGVPIGVVTDGRWWGLVCARPKAMVASGIVDAQTWVEEAQARDAFAALLHARQLVGGRAEDRLAQLFAESVAAAEEITESLGVQVRRAVELLVEAFSESARRCSGRGCPRAAARRPARRLRGRRHGDDAGRVPALRRGTRAAAARAAVCRGLRPHGPARRPRRAGPARGRGGARRHVLHVAPAARDVAGAVPRGDVRGPAPAGLRRLALRPGPVPVPAPAHRPGQPRRHGQRPGAAARPARGAGCPAARLGCPADLVPGHRRRADRLHLRGPARATPAGSPTRWSSGSWAGPVPNRRFRSTCSTASPSSTSATRRSPRRSSGGPRSTSRRASHRPRTRWPGRCAPATRWRTPSGPSCR